MSTLHVAGRYVSLAVKNATSTNPVVFIAVADSVRIGRVESLPGLPAICFGRNLVVSDGLMSHGSDINDLFWRGAVYVDKILKGTKPADLPVEQPTKFHRVINLKTANALGITIPKPLRLRADKVIE